MHFVCSNIGEHTGTTKRESLKLTSFTAWHPCKEEHRGAVFLELAARLSRFRSSLDTVELKTLIWGAVETVEAQQKAELRRVMFPIHPASGEMYMPMGAYKTWEAAVGDIPDRDTYMRWVGQGRYPSYALSHLVSLPRSA